VSLTNYILDRHGCALAEPDLMKWAQWFENSGGTRIIERTSIGEIMQVSTVFLGIDHQWLKGPPLLFETMIFGLKSGEYQERHSTLAEAIQGHFDACRFAEANP
jgi:hypothetical protein